MERLELEYYYGQEAEQFTFYRLPKALITDSCFKDISNSAKLLYGLMLDRMSLSVRSGWFDDENRVYIKYSVKSIMEDMNCSKMTAVGLLKELQGIGLLDVVQRNGLANIIYVKNFVSEEKATSADRSNNCTSKDIVPDILDQSEKDTVIGSRPVQKKDESEIHTGTSKESRLGGVQKVDPNNKEINNTESSDTNPIILSAQGCGRVTSAQDDEMDMATAYRV